MAALVNRMEKVAAVREGETGMTRFVFTEDDTTNKEE
jgi:hypothetical protein